MREQVKSRRGGGPAPVGRNYDCDGPRARPPLYACGRRLLTSWPFTETAILVTGVGGRAHDTRCASICPESGREGGGAAHQELNTYACDASSTRAAV
jgi:hypothetical protein